MPLKKRLKAVLLWGALFLVVFVPFYRVYAAQKLIIVEKSARVLYLYQDGHIWKSFPCSLGWNPEQPKRREGDGATPEGLYYICDKHPSKRYHLFLTLSYPNQTDWERAYWEGRIDQMTLREALADLKLGKIMKGPLGGDLGLHGGGLFRKGPKGLRRDWTFGCIALRDKDIEEVYRFADLGTPVFIYDAKKPLFDILSPLVSFSQALVFKLPYLPWQGEFYFSTLSLRLRVMIREDHDGLKRLWIWGYEPLSRQLLFWLVDYNANDRLDPMDRFCAFAPGARFWDYPRLRALVLGNLPQWLFDQERRGEPFKSYTP